MNRSLSRNFVVAATVLALTFACIPAASAQSSKAPAFKVPTSWLGAMLTMGGKRPILQGGQGSGHRGVQPKGKDDLTRPAIKIIPHTGSCIDPDGNRVPCESI
ncbi:MAG TPA: hypothetical protein VE685_09595 [Thermoanaerobaculia bacterium]|nr:hypothetical protein [Thermoanaerobaculia bacterium]